MRSQRKEESKKSVIPRYLEMAVMLLASRHVGRKWVDVIREHLKSGPVDDFGTIDLGDGLFISKVANNDYIVFHYIKKEAGASEYSAYVGTLDIDSDVFGAFVAEYALSLLDALIDTGREFCSADNPPDVVAESFMRLASGFLSDLFDPNDTDCHWVAGAGWYDGVHFNVPCPVEETYFERIRGLASQRIQAEDMAKLIVSNKYVC